MITDLHHTSLFVTDLDRSLPFYTDKLGFELVSRSDDWGGQFMSEIVTVTVNPGQHYSDGKAIKFQDPDGIILELQQPPAPGRIT